jgi:ABC-type multidrug transport system ATPase subunit
MNIQLENIGKKFGREWIFRKVNHVFEPGKPTVILGSNGSGKSTLLQIISGSLMEGEGKLKYEWNGKIISQEEVYQHVTIAAPYLELMEDFTLIESISFHGKFKRWRNGYDAKKILDRSGLFKSGNKQLKNFSSGMKQRVKLLLAILSDTPLLLLDEPCSNLDLDACAWYSELINEQGNNRTIIVCSNQVKEEFSFCKEEIRMENYKK